MDKTVQTRSDHTESDSHEETHYCGHGNAMYDTPTEAKSRASRMSNANNNANTDNERDSQYYKGPLANDDDWRRNHQYYKYVSVPVARAQSSESEYSDSDRHSPAWEREKGRYKNTDYGTHYERRSSSSSPYRLSSHSSINQSPPRMRSSQRGHVRNCPENARRVMTSAHHGSGTRVGSQNAGRTRTAERPLHGLLKKRRYDEGTERYHFERLYPSDSIEQLVSNRKQEAWRRDNTNVECPDTSYPSIKEWAECFTRPNIDHHTPECSYGYPLRHAMSDDDFDDGRLPVYCTCKNAPAVVNDPCGKRRQTPSKGKQPARSRKGTGASQGARNDTNNNATNARILRCTVSSSTEFTESTDSCEDVNIPRDIEHYLKCAIREGKLNLGCSKTKKRAPISKKKRQAASKSTTKTKAKPKSKPKKQSTKNKRCCPKTSVSIVVVSSSGNIHVKPIM